MTLPDNPPLEFTEITLVCKCGLERKFYPDRPLRGAPELIDWMKTKPTRCPCGLFATCDVKARVKPCACGSSYKCAPGETCGHPEMHDKPSAT